MVSTVYTVPDKEEGLSDERRVDFRRQSSPRSSLVVSSSFPGLILGFPWPCPSSILSLSCHGLVLSFHGLALVLYFHGLVLVLFFHALVPSRLSRMTRTWICGQISVATFVHFSTSSIATGPPTSAAAATSPRPTKSRPE